MGNYNLGFNTVASNTPGSALIAATMLNGTSTFLYANTSTGSSAVTLFAIGSGNATNQTLIGNYAFSSASYLGGGSTLFSSINQTQLIIGAMYNAGFIGFTVGGAALANEGMRLTSTALTINKGWDLVLTGSTSGAVSVNASTGTYNFNLPTTAGSTTQFLTSAGGGSTPMTWTPASSIAINRSVNSISSPASAGSTALTDYVYFVSGTTALTLPTAVGNTNLYTVKNTGAGTVTISTTSAQTIDGSSSASLPVANTSLDLISDGSNWRIV